MFTWRLVQGEGGMLPLTISACPVDASAALSGTVSGGTTSAALAVFTPAWAADGPPHLRIALTAVQTASLPPGGYVVQVGLANGGGSLAIGQLTILPAPGNLPAYDLLTTPGRVLLMNPEMRADPDRVAMLPVALRGASELIRRYCHRRFTRADYTEYHCPNLEGVVRLGEWPVHRVIRASWKPLTAVEITADPSVYQTAYVDFATQDDPLGDPERTTYTGINLVGTSDGTQTTTAIPFSTTPTLADLADAANAASGWKASAGGYGRWATSELYCDGTSQGALDDGVQLRVFSEDVSTSRVDRPTGMFYVGFGLYSDAFGPRWGPTWTDFADNNWTSEDVIRVSYNAGFTTVPDAIQDATVSMAKFVMDRMLVDFMLKKESIGEYTYELNDKLMGVGVPETIRGSISTYVGHRA